jgi:hypothetical protein
VICPPRTFSPTELAAVEEARHRAEELTGDYFKLPSFDGARYAYDLATLEQLEGTAIAPVALAELLRYGRDRCAARLPGCRRLQHFYRIGLNDPRLLARATRPAELEALLLYVVTHELVHIVRFEQFAELFAADRARREREEQHVHQLTAQVLRPVRSRHLDEVTGLFAAAELHPS